MPLQYVYNECLHLYNNNHKETFPRFPNDSLCWKFWDYIGYKALIQLPLATFENIYLLNLTSLLLRQILV